MTDRARVGSLFSGIGGLDLGLERAGMQVVWQCEKDDAATRVLNRRWPDVTTYDDVTTLKGSDVPAVDVLCGGFPCQDLSVAGRRAGLAGERSGLFHEFMRLADELAPRWVLIENVPGLLSSNDGADMGVVLGVLADLGYGWCYRVLDAQYFGVAQRRRRVFIVGCAGDPRAAGEVLLESDCCDGNPAPSREAREGVTGALGGGSGSRGWAPDTDRMTFVPSTAATLTGGSAGSPGVNPPGRRQEDDINLVGALTTRCGNSQDDQQTGQLVPTLRAAMGGSTTGHHWDGAVTMAFDWKQTGDRTASMTVREDRTDALTASHEPAIAYRKAQKAHDADDCERWEEADAIDTLSAHSTTSGSAVMDGMAVRRLMPVECERLQGFPDDWTAGESDSARYRLLGNAVCVPVAAWIGGRMVRAGVDRD